MKNMRTHTENKLLFELTELINKYGYWSNEVAEFNDKLNYNTMTKLNNILKK